MTQTIRDYCSEKTNQSVQLDTPVEKGATSPDDREIAAIVVGLVVVLAIVILIAFAFNYRYSLLYKIVQKGRQNTVDPDNISSVSVYVSHSDSATEYIPGKRSQ